MNNRKYKLIVMDIAIVFIASLMSFSSFAGEWIQGEHGIGWYYFENGQMLYDTLKEIDGKTYYFEPSGRMATFTTEKINGKYYVFNGDGELTKTSSMDPKTKNAFIMFGIIFALYLIYTIWYYSHPRQASSLATFAGAVASTMAIQKGVDNFLEKDREKSNELANRALDSVNRVNNLLGGNNDKEN